MTTLIAIIGAIATLATALNVASLVKLYFERKDNKDIMKTQVEANTQAIEELKEETKIIKAMCLGSLYDRTKFLAESYIKRGWVSVKEYEDWMHYLYIPYHDGGGDGTIDYLKDKLEELPNKEK